MVRRKQFRTILDGDVAKLRAFIKAEQEKRQEFSKHVHTYLPSQFCPQLRDNAPELHLEGSASEYNFADVKDAVTNYEPVKSPFDGMGEYDQNPQSRPPSARESPAEINIAQSNTSNSEMAKKIKELTTELQLRQGEYSSNLKEKEE